MKAKSDRVLSDAIVIALASMVANVAMAAAPTVSQVFFDLGSGEVSIVGTGFKPGTLVTLGSTAITVTATTTTVVTATLPALLPYGDYLMTIKTPNPSGGMI